MIRFDDFIIPAFDLFYCIFVRHRHSLSRLAFLMLLCVRTLFQQANIYTKNGMYKRDPCFRIAFELDSVAAPAIYARIVKLLERGGYIVE